MSRDSPFCEPRMAAALYSTGTKNTKRPHIAVIGARLSELIGR
jgi:hypothetical protein